MKVLSHVGSRFVTRGIAVLCVGVLVSSTAAPAHAAGVVGTGTAASCTDAALDAALAGGGLVTFNCGGPATIENSTPKKIAVATTVDGGGLITISGARGLLFSVAAGIEFAVHNLTIANSGQSGITSLGGSLIVTHSTFTGNNQGTSFPGGGIIVFGGTLSVSDSSFTGNGGGGIDLNGDEGSATVSNSTFAENDAGDNDGGGIENGDWTLAVTNSTFIGNRSGAGGAIENSGGTLTVINCSFSGNNGQVAGGAVNNIVDFSGSAGPVTVTNSIFSGNTDNSGNPSDNCGGPVTDGGHNLDDGTSCHFSAAKGSLSNTDPHLDPTGLRDNGGPTQTVALCTAMGVPAGCTAASPAIGAGDQGVCAMEPVNDLDQRGLARPGTGHTSCSMGAYEANATVPAACVGDCGGTGTVAITDLITLVNIALGNAQASACPHGVPGGAEVNVALIVQAVGNTLNGCG